MQENWNEKSMAELRAEAKARGLRGISGLRKQELAALLSGGEQAGAPEAKRTERTTKTSAPAAERTERTEKAGAPAAERTEQKEKSNAQGSAVNAENAASEAHQNHTKSESSDPVREHTVRRNPGNNNVESVGRTTRYGNYRNGEQRTQGENRRINGESRGSSAWMMPEQTDTRRRGRDNSGENSERSTENNGRNRDNYSENSGRSTENNGRTRDSYSENSGKSTENNGRTRDSYSENSGRSTENNGRTRDSYSENSGRSNENNRRNRDNYGENSGRNNESNGRNRGSYGENTRRGRDNYGENTRRGRNYGDSSENMNRRNYGDSGENMNRRNYGDGTENTGRRSYEDGTENTGRRNYGEGNENTGRRNYRDDNENTPRRNYENNQDADSQNASMSQRTAGHNTAASQRSAGTGDSQRIHMDGWNTGTSGEGLSAEDIRNLDSGVRAHGILEIIDNYGFIRGENYMPGDDDIYVSPNQIRRFHMRTGDVISGSVRVKTGAEKYAALLYVTDINGEAPASAEHRRNFEDLTPIFPNERIRLEHAGSSLTMRIVDLLSPIGKGQRGMIVSPPKAGKTTLLKDIAHSIQINNPEMHIVILLIDERPEEVTDIKECIQGENVEVIYSTFDELPDHHRRVSEMVLGRAKCLVEHGKDVVILLDSITRLARAYNLSVAPSGRTLSGGLDPAALYMPKKFFGAARNMREGGSLTILATALVDTGSRMDDVVFEEFKGTGNMEVVLDRKLSERRIFPAIDIQKSGTRREDLLLTAEEKESIDIIRRAISGMRSEDAVEQVLNLFARTKNNAEFVQMAKKIKL